MWGEGDCLGVIRYRALLIAQVGTFSPPVVVGIAKLGARVIAWV